MTHVEISLGWVFSQATGVVQGVLVTLLLASVACWAVILEKALVARRYSRQAKSFDALVRAGRAGLGGGKAADGLAGLPGTLLTQGRAELAANHAGESGPDRRDRVERAMRDALASELLHAESRLPYLATISSVAPFVGLFGTVWGIMHAFVGIAQTSDTSLAVVAPGIAESLFTTAAGLVAAIPASVAYNKLSADFRGVSRRVTLTIALLLRRSPMEELKPAAAEALDARA